MPVGTKYARIIIIALILMLIYSFGVGLRWKIVEHLDTYCGGLIYIRESALYFYFAKEFDEKGAVPELDFKAQYPDGFNVEREHNFAKGKLTAYAHRISGLRNMPFEAFARRFDALFFCLGIVPLFFAARLLAKNDWIALLCAAIYVVAMPALPRSTGAGFDMETFSIPLLIAHFCLFLYGITRGRFLFSLLSGFALGLAVAGWDFCQFYILIVAGFVLCAIFLIEEWRNLLKHFATALPGIIVAGIISGYLRSHYFLVSYGMLLAYPLGCAGIISIKKQIKRLYIAPSIVVAFFILAIFSSVIFDYSETYSHVGQKFVSKIKHLNVKPADPGKMTFTERIEWTPPFHSATQKFRNAYPFVQMLRYVIPAILPLALFIAGFSKGRRKMEEAAVIWNVFAFAALYLMFVRVEVLLVIFLILAFAIGWKFYSERSKAISFAFMSGWAVFLGFLLLFEIILAVPPSRNIGKFTPEDPEYIAALRGVLEAVKEGTEADSVVLADYTVSPVLLAYADRSIILHPKFESVQMRNRVQKYYEALFSVSEENLNRFCNEFGTDYFVFTYYVWQPEKYDNDDNINPGWIYSAKYIANATKRDFMPYGFRYLVSDDSRVAYFKPLPEWTVSVYNERYKMDIPHYKMFRNVSDEEKEKARKFLARAELNIRNEKYEEAKLELLAGIELFPGLPPKAYTQLGVVYKNLGDDENALRYMTMGATFWKEGRR